MIDEGDKLSVYLDNVKILKDGEEYIVPLSDLSIIVIDGVKTSITSRLLSTCSKYNVAVVICDKKHLPTGIYLPYNQHSRSVKMLNNQMSWQENLKNKLWKKIIEYKIENQAEILYKLTLNKERYNLLNEYRNSVEDKDKTNREAHAAKLYFYGIFGKDFSRSYDNIENAMLNYGYAIVRAYISRSIVSYGYNPALGIFHKSEYNQFALSDDFIEIFRPIVDYFVVKYYLSLPNTPLFLNQEIRGFLVSILDKRILYKSKMRKLSTVIDLFILDAFKYLEGKTGNLANVNLTSLKWSGKSEV